MYESPIEIITKDLVTKQENGIYQALAKADSELLKIDEEFTRLFQKAKQMEECIHGLDG